MNGSAVDPSILARWIGALLVEKREVMHMDFKAQASVDSLLKDIVALHNTPDSPYEGYGYIVLGISNAHEVVGLNLEDQRAFPTADRRENALIQALASHVHPMIDVRVVELALPTHPQLPLHVVEVKSGSLPWSMIHTDRKDRGFYIRRSTQSVPPKPAEVDAYLQRLLNLHLAPVQNQLLRMDQQVIQLRETVADLQYQRQPEAVSAAQQARIAFQTPERTLLRVVRRDIAKYLDDSAAATDTWKGLPFFTLDRLTPEQLDNEILDVDLRTRMREVMERQETVVRPLVEALGAIIHEADLTDRVKGAVGEMAQAVAYTSFQDPWSNGVTYTALNFYPAYLFLFGGCTAALTATDWTPLQLVLMSQRAVPTQDATPDIWPLIHALNLRPHLDLLVRLFDRTYPIAAAAERAKMLFHQADWLGSFLPATLKHQVTQQAEVILLLGAVAAARKMMIPTPVINGSWMHYPDAEKVLRQSIRAAIKSWQPVLGIPTEAEAVMTAVDEMMRSWHSRYAFSARRAFLAVDGFPNSSQ